MACLNWILELEDYSEFERFLEKLDDINRFIIDDDQTKLSVIHILVGKPETEFTKSCFHNILYCPNIEINKTATIQGCYNITAAHIAVKFQNFQILKMLISKGCDLFIVDSLGKNVQEYADKYGNEKIKNIVEFGVKKWCEAKPKSFMSYLNEQQQWPDWSVFASPSASPTKVRFADDVKDKREDPNETFSSTDAVAGTPTVSRTYPCGQTVKENKQKIFNYRQENNFYSGGNAYEYNSSKTAHANADSGSPGGNSHYNYGGLHKKDNNYSNNGEHKSSNNAYPNVDETSSGWNTHASDNHYKKDETNRKSFHNNFNRNKNSNFDYTCSGSNAQFNNDDHHKNNNANSKSSYENARANAYSDHDDNSSYPNNHFNYAEQGNTNIENHRSSYEYNDQYHFDNQNSNNFETDFTSPNNNYDDFHNDYSATNMNSCYGQQHYDYDQQNNAKFDEKKDYLKLESPHKQSAGFGSSCAGYFNADGKDYEENKDYKDYFKEYDHHTNFEQREQDSTYQNDYHNQAFNADFNETLKSTAQNDTLYLDAEDGALNQTFIKEKKNPSNNQKQDHTHDQPKENSFESHVSTRSVYTDPEDNTVKLVEERYAGSCILKNKTKENASLSGGDFEQCFGLNDDTIIAEENNLNDSNQSIATVIDDLILKMTNTQVHDALKCEGYNPGPVTDQTRSLYDRKLNRVQRSKRGEENLQNELLDYIRVPSPSANKAFRKLANYPLELSKLINRNFPFDEAIKLENQLTERFRYSEKPRTFFTYLLLDPQTAENLPQKANELFKNSLPNGRLELFEPELFVAFTLAIFYVGKGNNNRAYHHFNEAFLYVSGGMKPVKRASRMLNHWKENKLSISEKTQRIVEIWSQGLGAISLHCFTGMTSEEALAREALLIEVLSISNLTNQNYGQNLNKLTFNKQQRSILGTYLLFKAFVILLLNGECQIHKPSSS